MGPRPLVYVGPSTSRTLDYPLQLVCGGRRTTGAAGSLAAEIHFSESNTTATMVPPSAQGAIIKAAHSRQRRHCRFYSVRGGHKWRFLFSSKILLGALRTGRRCSRERLSKVLTTPAQMYNMVHTWILGISDSGITIGVFSFPKGVPHRTLRVGGHRRTTTQDAQHVLDIVVVVAAAADRPPFPLG